MLHIADYLKTILGTGNQDLVVFKQQLLKELLLLKNKSKFIAALSCLSGISPSTSPLPPVFVKNGHLCDSSQWNPVAR